MQLRSITNFNIKGKRVILRCGFDVPIKDGHVADVTRIRESIPTIEYLLRRGGTVILLSHLGRPEGTINQKMSLAPIVTELRTLLPNSRVDFFPGDISKPESAKKIASLGADVVLLENVRFYPGEEENDDAFAQQLAALGDIYVDDAFSVVHRAHASIEAITHFLPSYAGLLMVKEIAELSGLVEHPVRPYVAIIGGAKISTKLNLIRSLLKKADFVLLGGALANTILKAQGIQVGKSLIEEKMIATAKELSLTDNRLKIPVDVMTATSISPDAPMEKRAVGNVNPDQIILDIGPDTVELYSMIIKNAKTVVWNGPMGYFEIPQFAAGTHQIAERIAQVASVHSVVGGGETVDAINEAKLADRFSFISTGGGAMLEYLEGKMLPGIKPLIKK